MIHNAVATIAASRVCLAAGAARHGDDLYPHTVAHEPAPQSPAAAARLLRGLQRLVGCAVGAQGVPAAAGGPLAAAPGPQGPLCAACTPAQGRCGPTWCGGVARGCNAVTHLHSPPWGLYCVWMKRKQATTLRSRSFRARQAAGDVCMEKGQTGCGAVVQQGKVVVGRTVQSAVPSMDSPRSNWSTPATPYTD